MKGGTVVNNILIILIFVMYIVVLFQPNFFQAACMVLMLPGKSDVAFEQLITDRWHHNLSTVLVNRREMHFVISLAGLNKCQAQTHTDLSTCFSQIKRIHVRGVKKKNASIGKWQNDQSVLSELRFISFIGAKIKRRDVSADLC